MGRDLESAPGLTVSLLKTVLDGVICALQHDGDASGAATTAPVIAESLAVAVDAVRKALLDDSPSVLGARPGLVHSRGRGIKWEPEDDRCVAARVQFTHGPRWMLAGVVAPADSRGS